MALTMWTNTITGQRLDNDEMSRLRQRAHRLYEANTHIFEDEQDALVALGVEPLAGPVWAGAIVALPPVAA